MLRIECTCGKFLKVDEKLLGKKIKCPACSEIQLVKKPGSVTPPAVGEHVKTGRSAKPKTSPDADMGVTPAPKKKMAAANVAPGSTMPKKRMTREDDGDDAPPRKKQPAKKGGNKGLLLVLAGVGGFLFLAVAGAAIWFFVLGSSKTEVVKGPSKNIGGAPKGEQEPVAIKLFVPRKPGDRREVKLTAEMKMEMKVDDVSSLPPEMQSALASLGAEHDKTTLHGVLRTLTVNDMGAETKVELTVNQLDTKQMKKQPGQPPAPTVPKGTVVIGTLGDRSFSWSNPNGDKFGVTGKYLDLLVGGFFNEPESDADLLFGTAEKHAVGGTWKVNKEGLSTHLAEASFFGMSDKKSVKVTSLDGSGKLAKLSAEGAKDYADVDLNVKGSLKDQAGSATIQLVLSIRVPQDGSTGPVKKVAKAQGKVENKSEIPVGAGKPDAMVTMNIAFEMTGTTEIKYLDSIPVEEVPAPKDIKKPAAPLSLRLGLAQVAWLDGQAAVKVSANYSIDKGTPKTNASYICYLRLATDGGMKDYVVQRLDGSMMDSDGRFTNDNLVVSVPPKDKTRMCELVVMEKVDAVPGESPIDKKSNVNIGGTPPSTAPPAPAKAEVSFSNPKVERLGGKMMRFTVDYKFTGGAPDPKMTYRLFTNLIGGKAKKGPYNSYEVTGDKLKSKDTISEDFVVDAGSADATSFELWLTEGPPGGKKGPQGTQIAATVSGQVTGAAPDPKAGNLHFQISTLAARLPGQPAKKGVPPAQQYQFQFTWNLTKGVINKDATYTVFAIAGGAATPIGQPVPGNQFQPSGKYASPNLPYVPGLNAVDIYIMEQLPGQQARKVSNDGKATIR